MSLPHHALHRTRIAQLTVTLLFLLSVIAIITPTRTTYAASTCPGFIPATINTPDLLITAITQANSANCLGADTIDLSGNTITFSSAGYHDGSAPVALPSITTPITITNGTLTRSSASEFKFLYAIGTTLNLDNLTFSNGGGTSVNNGGAVRTLDSTLTITNSTFLNNTSSGNGGAVFAAQTALTITNSTFLNNTAGSRGGAINYVISSGTNTFNITNSSFTNNRAQSTGTQALGGAIFAQIATGNSGTISGSTFSGNQALNGSSSNDGGAIYKQGLGSLSVSGSAFTGNSATGAGGAFYNNQGSLSVTSSRIESNTASSSGGAYFAVDATTNTISGSCIVNNSDTAVVTVGVTTDIAATGNWWGSSWGPQIAARTGSNSALSSGDSINGDGVATSGDGIGEVHVGLTNANSTPPTGDWLTSPPTIGGVPCTSRDLVVTKTADSNDNVCNADCSLREAITVANTRAGDDLITFAPSANGVITLGSELPVIANNGALTIIGNGTANTIVEAAATPNTAAYRIFATAADSSLTLSNMTFRHGGNSSSGSSGGCINVGTMTTLSITNMVFTNCRSAGSGGGAIAMFNGGSATIIDSTFSNNTTVPTSGGGALYFNRGLPENSIVVEITGSTFTNNSVSTTLSGRNGGAISCITCQLTLTDSTFSGNSITSTGGTAYSGALHVNTDSTATLSGLTFIDNSVSAVGEAGGGALYISPQRAAPTTLDNSIFSGNSVSGGTPLGGAIFAGGNSLTITNSTFSGHTSGTSSAIHAAGNGAVTLNNSTVSGNTGGVITATSSSILNLNNTIIANNSATDCVRADGTINARNSLIEGGLGCVNGTNTNNLTGDPALNGDLTLSSSSPAINTGSNALAVDANGNPLTFDLAGNTRIQQGTVDMGAYESPFTPALLPDVTINSSFIVEEGNSANFTITRTGGTASALAVTVNITRGTGMEDADYTLSGGLSGSLVGSQTVTIPAGQASVNVTFAAVQDVEAEANNTLTLALVDGAAYNLGADTSSTATIPANDFVVTNLNDSGDGSLRQAITNANAFPTNDTITFTAGANGTITLGSALPNIVNNGTLTITGNSAANTIISGGGAVRIFTIDTDANVTISGVTLTNGFDAAWGGAIDNSGTLSISSSTISDNNGGNYGGGIYSTLSTSLTVTSSIISGNNAGSGGGIYARGTLTVSNSTISGNTAAPTNADIASGSGGGIVTSALTTIRNSIVSGNSATNDGGGILTFLGVNLTLINSTISGNTADAGGGINGGVDTGTTYFGTITVINSTLSGNSSGIKNGGTGTVNLRNSIVANSTGTDCTRLSGTINAQNSLIEGGLTCVNGTNINNLAIDPALNDDLTDLTLSFVSPAIDAGDDSLIPDGVTKDITGVNNRIQGLSVDMGAYESSHTAPIPPELTIDDVSAYEGNSGSTTFWFTVRLSDGALPGGVIFDIATADGTATTGDMDYSSESLTHQIIPQGGTLYTIPIMVFGDTKFEPDETFFVNVTNVTGATVRDGQAQGTILNDDAAPPDVTINPSFSVEEGDNANFTITRTGDTTIELVVTVNITRGTGMEAADYTLSGGGLSGSPVGNQTVTIPAGQASVNVTITAVDDVDAEADNTLRMQLVDGAAYNLGATTSSTATIPANDFVVTNTNDSGDGSLRQAIINANAFAGADTITFTVGANGTIRPSSELPEITDTLTITGNGTANTIISGNDARRVLTHVSGTLTISDLTIRDGKPADDVAGGIYAGSTLNVSNVHFIDNASTYGYGGGAIFNAAGVTLTVSNSVFRNNSHSADGSAIFNFQATATIINSLFTGNSGGAVKTENGSVTIINSTFSGNLASAGGGIVNGPNNGVINLLNSIVANSSMSDCERVTGTINAQNSLIESGLECVNGTNINNLTGDPTLNGDLTLSSTSPAINMGSNALIPGGVTTDLAGNTRIQQGTVDMGAYESSFASIPDVTISPAAFNVNEGANGNFTISRTAPTTSDLAVTVNITQGAGTVAADYTLSGGTITGQNGSQTVTIPAGQASVNVNIAATDDAIDEANETVTLTLVDTAAYNLGATTVSTATIVDNDSAGITISPTGGLVTTEAGGTATFTVVLNSQPTADVTIGLSSSDTTEGTVSPNSLTFTNGNWNAAQTVTVTGVDDFIHDGNLAYTIITAAAVSDDDNYNGLNPADVSVTNSDDDVAGITVNPTSGLVTTEAGGTAQFTVLLNSQPTADVTIGLSSSDITEGTVDPTSLTFTPGNWNVAQTVTVTGVDDAEVDGNIAYTIITAEAVSTDLNYSGLNPADVSVTNNDNDVAGITVNPTSGLVTTEAGGTATFTVLLNSQPTADVTISLSSSDITEGTVNPTSLTFTTSNWNVAQTVTVTGVDDAEVDGNIAYTIITAAVSDDDNYDGLNPADVSVTNNDNDVAGITVNPTGGLVTTEAGGTAQFTVVLNTQPTADVTIGLSSSDTTEGTVDPTSLTFTNSNWNVAQTVMVTGVDDAEVDGNIAYTIITAAAVSDDDNYDGMPVADVAVTNNDNDVAGITVNPTSGLVTTEAGGTAQFTVVLNSQPTADVTIGLSSSDTTEGTVNPMSLTFTDSNWNVAQTVTVTGVDDAEVDGNIAYTIITAAAVSDDDNYDGLNPADVSVTNNDNDVAGITVNPTSGLVTTEAGGTDTFTVVLNTQPTADVTIGLSSSDTTEGMVDPTSLTFTPGNWNVAQTVTVTGVSDLVVDGNVAYTIITTAATSDDPNYNNMEVADVSVTNNDTTSLSSLTVQLTLQARPAAPNDAYRVTGEVEIRSTSGGAPILATTFMADNMGQFTLDNLPVGMYHVWIKGDHMLARRHENVVVAVGSGNLLTTALLLEGDANNDNFINILDFSILSQAYGTQASDAAYDARADFNMDGLVTLVDFSLLASNFSVEGDA